MSLAGRDASFGGLNDYPVRWFRPLTRSDPPSENSSFYPLSSIEDFKNIKSPFRSVLAKSIFDGNVIDEVALVKEKNIPCLVIFGKDELVINNNYLDNAQLPLWNGTIFQIAGASHLVNIDQPGEFNKLLGEFCNDIF